jgi:2,4-dienoyl-CoA reductase-like NADH-dependent reductase (Old Yellow Enzyme family)/thioredoxin reductase
MQETQALPLQPIQHLFSSFHLKRLAFRNRIVMPGLATFLIGPDGFITSKTVEHYRRRAGGGPAMVIMEACAVSPEGRVSSHQARIYDDRFVEGLSQIASAVKSEGAIAAVQIHHGGRQTSFKVIGRKPYAPSPLSCPSISGEVEVLTSEGIHKLVYQFAEAAVRARDAGFDLIEIHGAHGYLVNQFLSPFSNIRDDGYGGNVAGRARFAQEIVRAIRQRVGWSFPLSFKISAQEFVPGGLTVDESVEILKILCEAGIDIVQVSAGNDATPEWICQPMFMKKACLASSSEKIRSSLKIPVMAVGRINDPETAESVIASGQADLVCMGRGLLADPDMPNKAKTGKYDDIRYCIACNTCMESIFRKGKIECLVNPFLGREQELVCRPADRRRKVMVIGGGPGGLNAAWLAAKRGHRVLLYDQHRVLGGQLVPGSMPAFKRELKSLIRFLSKQVEKHGVVCRLGCQVSANTVRQENPDVVIIATGSNPFIPLIAGIDRPFVFSYNQVLELYRPEPCKTVVIGGGTTGCEIALHLAENGSSVTIVELFSKIGRGLETISRKVLLSRLAELGVEFLTDSHLSKIEENGVVVHVGENAEHFIEAERVVLATGCRPEKKLYEEIRELGFETKIIGDCLEPRNAKSAIYEGTLVGLSI